MPHMVKGLGFWSRLAVLAVASAAAAATAVAQKQPPAFKKSPDDCFKFPVTYSDAQLRTVADVCSQQFQTARKYPDELANAGLHAGSAYNRLKEFSQAAKILERVSLDGKGGPAALTETKYQLAVAYLGQGNLLQPNDTERGTFLGKTIGTLDEVLASPSVSRGSWLYNTAVFQRASAYRARGGGTLDYNNAIDGFAALAEGGPGVDPAMRDDARKNLIEVAVKAGANELKPETSDSPAAQRAVALYEKALRFDARNVDLNLGLGDARLIIARAAATPGEKTAWFERARDAYREALSSGPTGAKAGAANLGLGRSTRGMGQLREAIAYFKTAASSDGTNYKAISELAEAQLEYAKSLNNAQEKQAAYKEAEQSYQSLLKQQGLPAADKASVLMKLADVQGQQPNRIADVQKTLTDALAADRNSVSTRIELAKTYYAQSMFADARPHLMQVIDATGGEAGATPPGQAKVKADAFHYLSLIESRDAVSQNAVKYADLAVKVGGRETPYREQACIAHIMRGDKAVTDPGNSAACTGNDQPEGLLLSGMFYLRYAQYAAPAAKAALRDAAKTNFQQGVREAVRQAKTPPDTVSFKRPGASGSPPVIDLLKYGSGVAEGCSGLTANVDLNQGQYDAASAFYAAYRVNECRPN